MATNVSIAARASRTTGGFKSGAQWPPRAGYYTPAKMPMNVIFPRPDGETQAHARQKWAHSGFRYEIPIGVQGGAWPFKYEITSDTTGVAEIGQYYGDDDYGVLKINPSTLTHGNSYSYTVRVTDAGGDYVDIARSFTIDDSMFVFIQAGYAGTKVGTISQPLENFVDWWKDSATDNTYHNKISVWRGGVYSPTGNSAANPENVEFERLYKTPSLIGFPDENPIFDCVNAKFYDNSSMDDFYIAGITFRNARNDVGNAHFWWLAGASDRVTFFRNNFTDIGAGTAGTDNASCIFISSLGASNIRNYNLLKHCTFENVNNGVGGNGSYIDVYRLDNFLWEENTAKNCSTNYGWWNKCGRAFGSIRGNVATENVTGSQISVLYGSDAGGVPHDNEVCWNIIKSPGLVIRIAYSHHWDGQYYNTWLYRNTAVGDTSTVSQGGLAPTYTGANIFAIDNTSNLALDDSEATHADIVTTENTSILKSDATLAGATGFGTNGGEIF